jgi:HEAT repeat protein
MHTLPRLLLPAAALLPLALGLPSLKAADADTAEAEQILKKARVAVDGPALVEFFRKRTVTPATEQRIAALVGKLGARAFRVRSRASKELIGIGVPALAALRRALKDPDVEVRDRANKCLETIERDSPPELPLAAARLLKVHKPDKACPVLLGYLPFADNGEVEEEVLAALVALGLKGGKADAALVAALTDKVPVRRAAAGLVVGQSGDAGQRKAVRGLLADKSAKVRCYAAQGLFRGKDKAAIPVLIDLLEEGPLDLARQAEDALASLTETAVAKVDLAEDRAARRKVRQAWSGWWKANEAKLDLAKIDLDSRATRLTRARQIAQRCLDAIVKLDAAAFKKTLKLPVYLQAGGGIGNKNQLETNEQVDQLFKLMEGAGGKEQMKQVSFKVTSVGRLEDHVKNVPQMEKDFLKKFRKQDLVVVYVRIAMGGKVGHTTQMPMYVRVAAGRAAVVGFSQERGVAKERKK